MGQGSPRRADRAHGWSAVTDMLAGQARRTPDRPAVEAGGATLSYAGLAARVELFAGRLAARLPAGGARVAVCLERDADMLAWLLAVLRVGASYLPLDPSLPAARLAQVLDDAAPALIVASRGLLPALPPTALPVLVTDDAAPARPAPPVTIRPDMLAYTIYTSGSTGRPKGVEIEHGSLAALLATMAEMPGFAAGQTMLGLTRISFDLSVPDLFLPLAAGGTLVLVGLDVAADPERLGAALARHRPDLVQATPSTWRALVEAGWAGLPGLRLLAGGEAMTRDLADRLLPRCGELWNIYGPTEATVWATATRVRPGHGPVPIGWPLTGVEIDLLDEVLRPVGPGEVGEIAIGGTGVARGYHARPELTADRFVRLEDGRRVYRTGDLGRFGADGALFCLGRSDDQVKLRGFRIELGDIEAALAEQPDVAWCAARLCTDPHGEPTLVGYVVPRLDSAPSAASVKAGLAARIPAYMVPDRIVIVPAMPLTPNGKVDRAALPSPFGQAAAASDVTHAGVEGALAAIWCDLLGVASVGRSDDFFDLGGYSLMTVRLARRIEAAFGVKLALIDLLRWSTLEAMAGRIADGDAAPGAPDGMMLLNGGGDLPPLYWLDAGPLMRTVLRELPAGRPTVALIATADDEAALGTGEVAIEAVAARFRDRLIAHQPDGPFVLGGWCRWGIVAFELAAQLRRAGRTVELLVMLDADRPGARAGVGVRGRLAALIRRAAAAPAAPESLSQRVEHALRRYRAPAYDGAVLLLRPASRPVAGGWGALLGDRLTVAVSGGDHESMVRLPHARELAAAMARHLLPADELALASGGASSIRTG